MEKGTVKLQFLADLVETPSPSLIQSWFVSWLKTWGFGHGKMSPKVRALSTEWRERVCCIILYANCFKSFAPDIVDGAYMEGLCTASQKWTTKFNMNLSAFKNIRL